ncbi:MAG: hypothetical protein PHO83_09960 [Geobacteraceae bacterium]|nr:hypothetical protein [Geobacteraceae bacterium]
MRISSSSSSSAYRFKDLFPGQSGAGPWREQFTERLPLYLAPSRRYAEVLHASSVNAASVVPVGKEVVKLYEICR